MSGEQLNLHNELAGKIVADIVRPVIGAGGEYKDVLILLESVVVGVALMAIKMGGDGPVLDLVFERAKERLTEIRPQERRSGRLRMSGFVSIRDMRIEEGLPVRLQLSRAKGFNLQALSRATNGLEAVNCARPHRDGNQFAVGQPYQTKGARTYYVTDAHHAVALHRAEIRRWMRDDPQACELMWKRLRGKNLACWCKLDRPCHTDTLLEFANA